MQIPPVALKRNNHRLLLCIQTRKNDLLALLIGENEGKKIAVAVSADADTISVPDHVTVVTDEMLAAGDAAPCELLISYDLPADPVRYIARLALAAETALTLLGEADRVHLLGIETLIGRAVSQERPEGFAPELPAKPAQKPRPKREMPNKEHVPREKRETQNKERAPREKREEKPAYNKNSKPAAPKRKPKESGVSRYLGKDENGKPIFSGKSGERNHRRDGKPHDDESLAAKKEWDDKRKKEGGAKKEFDPKKRPPYQGEKPKYKGEKPPFKGEKKPYDAKKAQGKSEASARDKKPASVKPKRPMIRIKAEALKPKEPKK